MSKGINASGNKVQGGKVIKEHKEKVKVYKRNKDVCPICHVVTMYLTTHLQRVHKMDKNGDEYKRVLPMARRYCGRSAEVMWDKELIAKKVTIAAQRNFGIRDRVRIVGTDVDAVQKDTEDPPQKKRKVNPLQLLLDQENLSSTSSNESYFDDTVTVVPPKPTPTRSRRSVLLTHATNSKDDGQGEVAETSTRVTRSKNDDQGEAVEASARATCRKDDDRGEAMETSTEKEDHVECDKNRLQVRMRMTIKVLMIMKKP